jgi:probable HAF family extracellular repeat protein
MNRSRVRRAALGLALVAFVGSSTSAGGAPAPPAPNRASYRVEDLGTLPGDDASVAMGINELGDVVGWSVGPAGTRAFVYTTAAGMTALSSPAGRPVTTARAINATGTVVGNASTGGTDIGHAVRWRSGTVRDLGTLGNGQFSDARGVNAGGVVVGRSYTNGGGLLGIHAFRYDDTARLVDLTPGIDSAYAEAINDAGQVAGSRNGRAFRLSGTTFTELGIPAGFRDAFPAAINGSGQVAGHVISASGNSERIFRYTDGHGMVILGGVGEHNEAFGINAAGSVVGVGRPVSGPRQGFLYTDANGMQALNALIDPGAGWFVLGAGDINDAGQIVGWASGPFGQRAVRLTPTVVVPPVAPAAPSALAGSVLAPSSVRLSWTDNATNEVGFRIERSVGAQGKFVLLAQPSIDAATYTDGTVRAHTVFRYRVRAYNAAGSSAWSNIVTVTVP